MWRSFPAAVLILLCVCIDLGAAETQPGRASASCEWGSGYGADAAADGIADENGNYWQTVQGKDRGAWWQVDFRREVRFGSVRIVWARWEDKVHCPPACVVILVSPSGAEGSWKEVRKISRDELPRDGEPYREELSRRYEFPPTPARYLRLSFPDGGQGIKYPGYLCLGEVEVPVPPLPSKLVTLEGPFGEATIDVAWPAMVSLRLRGPKGLGSQSVLATRGVAAYPGYGRGRGRLPWAQSGYTYAVADDGTRYESHAAAPEKVDVSQESGRTVLRMTGIKLTAGASLPPVATEDWNLSSPGDGIRLAWKITRRWNRDLRAVMSGSPGLFSGFDARRVKNSVTSTIWCDPLCLAAQSSDLYAMAISAPGRICENHLQTVRDRDAWAVYKLWTNWHAPADLRLDVAGGYLYRRGSFAYLSEAGAITAAEAVQSHTAGQVEEICLWISPVDKGDTGYQLAFTIPDKATEISLKDFYGSVLNGGAVNDQKGFDFGNETDGWYYAGSSWMYGAALAAGMPAPGPLSSRPYDAARAFRRHLVHILSTLDDQGRSHFGYNQTGQWVDDNLHTIQGAHFYLMHTGDLDFARQHLPVLERMLAYFIQRRNSRGLFQLAETGAHWYYDCIPTGGVNSYYNAFFYKAVLDLADMEHAAGREAKAREYRDLAAAICTAFNAVLWKENAPGGPRYLDWINASGKEVAYFCDICQWPPVAVGIASPEQARKIVATADARIKELEREYMYPGYASLSALWPVPAEINPAWQPYGIYMNGGSLLCQTYWEVAARARAGDAAGASRRLRLFAQRASETSWAGNNSANLLGERGKNESGEPYLADMVAATASVIHGLFGVRPTWDQLEVAPHLPADWPRAEAEVLYKGRRHRVTVEGSKPQVQAREQVLDPRPLWEMDSNLRAGPGGPAVLSNIDLGNAGLIALQKLPKACGRTSYVTSGSYQSPMCDWGGMVRPAEFTVVADLNGGAATATLQFSDDGFKSLRAEMPLLLRGGLNSYPLSPKSEATRAVRVRFDLKPSKDGGASPVIDGFRLTGTHAE